ncbi:threonine--tRNA ligase [Kitasatospora sp. NPDC028055]|uniref:threonine--tRNA ligase n=1 Tax=Kitasatospora sp. NPDC028055 TaxID=3155653 RepID=UPI00340CFFB3
MAEAPVLEQDPHLPLSVEADASPFALLQGEARTVGRPGTVVAVEAAGRTEPLRQPFAEAGEARVLTAGSAAGLRVLRATAALVLAMAVREEFPDALPAGSGLTEDGFHVDFADLAPVTPEVLKRLDKRMRRITRRRLPIDALRLASAEEAAGAADGNRFLREIAEEAFGQDEPGQDAPGAFRQSVGPQGAEPLWTGIGTEVTAPDTGYLTAFELESSSAVYWRGDEANESLQRIKGTAWADEEALARHRAFLEEAARRDHRRLGSEMELFTFADEIGPGLPILLPNGAAIRDEMQRYSLDKHRRSGYTLINTPFIAKEELFLRSGHLPYYADGMFPGMAVDGSEYYLKAMNCPMHAVVFKNRGRSYKELPLRLFEFGSVHRYERSGTLHGLTRVRNMTQDDAHIFCTQEQIQEELKTVLAFVLDLLRDFGLRDFYLELSTRDDSDKFIGSEEDWANATAALVAAADSTGLELVPDPGGAAFYGPKISVQVRDSLGRNWQMSTIQLDFQTPARFELSYQAADGSRVRPVMIHRALFGSLERFLGVLIEHYGGQFPAWMAPVHVAGVPVRADAEAGHTQYLADFLDGLRDAGVRSQLDASSDRLPKKILNAQRLRAPFVVVAGDRDVAAGTASLRFRDGSQESDVPLAEIADRILATIASRETDSPTAVVRPSSDG